MNSILLICLLSALVGLAAAVYVLHPLGSVRPNKGTDPGTGQPNRSEPQMPPQPAASEPARSIVLLGEIGDPLVEFTRLDRSEEPECQPFRLPEPMKRSLESLLRVPSKMLEGVATGSTTYVLQFSPGVMEQLEAGSAVLTRSAEGGFHAIARDAKTGQVIENGWLQPATRCNAAVLAAAAWQIAAAVTAQKFLADIDRRLAHIEKALTDIRDWLRNQRLCELEADLAYLCQVATVLNSGSFTAAEIMVYHSRLEEIELWCSGVMRQVTTERGHRQDELLAQKVKGFLPGQFEREIGSHLGEFETHVRSFLLAVFVRTAVSQLTCALPVNHAAVRMRLAELEAEIGRGEGWQGEWLTLAEERVRGLKGYLWEWAGDRAGQQRLNDRIAEIQERIKVYGDEVRCALSSVSAMLPEERDRPTRSLSLAVRLGPDGEIISAGRILDDRRAATVR